MFGNYCEYYQDTSKMINILNNSNLPMVMDGEEFLMRYSNGEISVESQFNFLQKIKRDWARVLLA